MSADRVCRYPYDDIKDWGAIRWALPALYMMLDGQSEAAGLAIRRLLPANMAVFRWQALLTQEHVPQDMDNTSADAIQSMCQLGRDIVTANSQVIDKLCALLSV